MRVQISDHQHKTRALYEALMLEGVEIVRNCADILLIDWDGMIANYPKIIEKAYQEGAEIVLYSHGAPVIVVWDSVWEPYQYTRHYLAQSPGQKHVMESYGYPVPITVIGWHFCEQKPFQPVKEVKNVLFAPWHPHGNGWLNPVPKEANAALFRQLTKLPYKLTVRHILEPGQSGIDMMPGVIYQRSNKTLEQSVQAIDEADVIISNPGTFATLAVARGKPVVMYAQNIHPHDGFSYEGVHHVKHWELYRDYMYYPLDIDYMNAGSIQKMIEFAAGHEATDWRNKFVGEQLRPDVLMEVLKGVIEDAKSEQL